MPRVWCAEYLEKLNGYPAIVIDYNEDEDRLIEVFRSHFPLKMSQGEHTYCPGDTAKQCWNDFNNIAITKWQAACALVGVSPCWNDDSESDIIRMTASIMPDNTLYLPKANSSCAAGLSTKKDLYEDLLDEAKKHTNVNSGLSFL